MATFLGTNGNDTISPGLVSAGVTRLPAGSFPSGANDILDGDDGDDSLFGGGGLDTILGGSGNDTLIATASASVDGGDDNDSVWVNSAGPATTIAGGAGNDSMTATVAVDISAATVTGFETLALIAQPLTLTTTQLGQFNSIVSSSGATSGSLVLSAGGSATTDVFDLSTLSVTGSAGNDEVIFLTPGAVKTNITVNAGFGNDTVYGAGGNDSLTGGDGNDFLSGRAGLDTLNGGNGNDTIAVFSGDAANGQADDDIFVQGEAALGAATAISGGTGIDRLIISTTRQIDAGAAISGVEILALNIGTLTLSGKQLDGFDTITNDSNSTAYTILLTTGGQTEVVASADVTALDLLTVIGTAINDRLAFTASGIDPTRLFVDGLGGDDSLATGAGHDTLEGGADNDTLDGGGGVDVLRGEAGNDVLFIRDQDDAYGGDGNDLFELLENATVAKVFDGGLGNDTLDPSGTRSIAAGVIIQNIETLALDASLLTLTTAQLGSFATIIADGAATNGGLGLSAGGTASLAVTGLAALKIGGSTAAEVLSISAGAGTSLTLDGNGGDDQLTAGAGNDSLFGGDGADSLDGLGGLDRLEGDDGNDVLVIRAGDSAFGGADTDLFRVVETLTGTEVLDGGAGNADRLDAIGALTIAAGTTIDSIEELALDAAGITLTTATLGRFQTIVAAGADTASTILLSGGGIAAVGVQGLASLGVTGSAANDSLGFGNAAAAAITAALGMGEDSIAAGQLADLLSGDAGNDTLSGLGDNDSLNGGQGVDLLLGGSGADVLNGGTETDILVGGTGKDRLTGGSAADFFRWDLPTEGQDTVRDFTTALGDRLQFDASGFGGGLAGGVALAAGQLVVHALSDATSPTGTGQFIFNTAKSLLLWDADGSGGAAAVKIAKLSGVTTLGTGDFDIIA